MRAGAAAERADLRSSLRVATTCRVTLRPTILIGMPLVKTTCAASGSHQILNSAAGVELPKVSDPPIRLICLTRFASDGSRWSAVAMLVRGTDGDQREVIAGLRFGDDDVRRMLSASGTVGGSSTDHRDHSHHAPRARGERHAPVAAPCPSRWGSR